MRTTEGETTDAGVGEGAVAWLAEELWANSASPGASPTDAHRDLVRSVLASDWLGAVRRRSGDDRAERIAQAIQAARPLYPLRDHTSTHAAYDNAVRIARETR